ncbi:hypothetical protein BDV41DRAFT_581565 [Aspergillus transmontanensis]|uniref:Uncharacterized protein n=1 Tax=Aspergillus transmontanensis TaxID=1034304 RepID=A0A5N6VIL4_9EURO|nr:hypothetical protein BDV41DRAFT_581565 [Aspergillus transmontanensis]
MSKLFLLGFSLANLVNSQECKQSFRLYAYGEGIGGLPVFFADGSAEIGNRSLSTANETVSIYCKTFNPNVDPNVDPNTLEAQKAASILTDALVVTIPEDTPNIWWAQSNRTESRSASFDSLVFTLPSISGTSGGNVGFRDPDDPSGLGTEIKDLQLYGNYVLIDSPNANFLLRRGARPESTHCIRPSTDFVLAGGFNPRGEL